MKNKLFAAVLASMLLFSGCGAQQRYYDAATTSSMAIEEYNGSAVAGETSMSNSAGLVSYERKITKSSRFFLETKNFDEDCQTLKNMSDSYGGYIESSSQSGRVEDGTAYADIVFKVPAEKYEDFKAELSSVGNIVNSRESADDITAQYYDTEARLKIYRDEEARFLELMEKAESVEELISIEEKLWSIRAEIESLETSMRMFDELISLATVSVNLSQTEVYTKTGGGFWYEIKNALSNTWSVALSVLQGLLIVIIYALPYLIIGGIISAVVVFAVKRRRNALPPQAGGSTPKITEENK